MADTTIQGLPSVAPKTKSEYHELKRICVIPSNSCNLCYRMKRITQMSLLESFLSAPACADMSAPKAGRRQTGAARTGRRIIRIICVICVDS